MTDRDTKTTKKKILIRSRRGAARGARGRAGNRDLETRDGHSARGAGGGRRRPRVPRSRESCVRARMRARYMVCVTARLPDANRSRVSCGKLARSRSAFSCSIMRLNSLKSSIASTASTSSRAAWQDLVRDA